MYPYACRRYRYFGPLSGIEALLQATYWGGTTACNVVGVRNLAGASSRAGRLSVINHVPSFFANQLGFAADLVGVSLQSLARFHGSVGRMASFKASLTSPSRQ